MHSKQQTFKAARKQSKQAISSILTAFCNRLANNNHIQTASNQKASTVSAVKSGSHGRVGRRPEA
jgi:hypothetical protein